MLDEWASYRDVANLGYGHDTVNHSLHFVDPVTEVHTQNAEGQWSQVKRNFRRAFRDVFTRIHVAKSSPGQRSDEYVVLDPSLLFLNTVA